MHQLFAVISLVVLASTNGQLLWNDTAINDIGCSYPAAIHFPTYFFEALQGISQSFKLYTPMATTTLLRWMYELVEDTPAQNQNYIESLKPRVIFPNLAGLPFKQGKVELFDPPTAYYEASCFPENLAFTNLTCTVSASEGSAPSGFGTGNPVGTTIIWADETAFIEWHCFLGNRQVFDVVSLNKNLTVQQINKVLNVVVPLGFNPKNIEYVSYD